MNRQPALGMMFKCNKLTKQFFTLKQILKWISDDVEGNCAHPLFLPSYIKIIKVPY